MSLEIERKFLVRSPAWREAAQRSQRMRQGYFGGTTLSSIRVRLAGSRCSLNIKSRIAGTTRDEYEYEIPRADAEEMLARLCDGGEIDKIRHWVPCENHLYEVDEFFGENAGLVVAEIELDAETDVFPRPPWLGEEVTDDERYYNHHLASRPWHAWRERTREA